MNKTLLPQAIVGLVDIVSSTNLGREVGALVDLEIKEAFFAKAQDLAQNEIQILNNTGDGFLFTAKTVKAAALYQKALVRAFNQILAQHTLKTQSGLRMGLTQGDIVVKDLGNGSFMAAGAAIYLAARFCANCLPNQIVMSEELWGSLRTGHAVEQTFTGLKGFAHDIRAMHVRLELSHASERYQDHGLNGRL